MAKLPTVETRMIAVELTEQELLALAQQLADAYRAKMNEEETQTAAKAQMKARLAELEATLARLYGVLGDKREYRNVGVLLRLNAAGMVEEIRQDTGELIFTRPPYASERQLELEANHDNINQAGE